MNNSQTALKVLCVRWRTLIVEFEKKKKTLAVTGQSENCITWDREEIGKRAYMED